MDTLQAWYKKSLIEEFHERDLLISKLIGIIKFYKESRVMGKILSKDLSDELLQRCIDSPNANVKLLAKAFNVSVQTVYSHRRKAKKKVKRPAERVQPESVKAQKRESVKKQIAEIESIKFDTPYLTNTQIEDNIKHLKECKKLNTAVDVFANEMRAKLHLMAKAGLAGWDELNEDDNFYQALYYIKILGLLKKQKEGGYQEVDLANYAMFLYFINHPDLLK